MKTIYAIPGLGTTARLFQFIEIEGAEIVVLHWPQPAKNMSLPDYAKAFLRQIDTSKPFYLMGVSFGGMLCTELSKLTRPEKTILISSCKSRRELPRLIRLFRYLPLHNMIPEGLLRKMAYRSRWLLGFEKSYQADFAEMVNAMPAGYFGSCIGCIVNWHNKEVPANTLHIHGNADRLLLYNYVQATHTIPSGSHAMVVYQAGEINRLLAQLL